MSFPLAMYLSRSKTLAVWPHLDRKAVEGGLQTLKSAINLPLVGFDRETHPLRRSSSMIADAGRSFAAPADGSRLVHLGQGEAQHGEPPPLGRPFYRRSRAPKARPDR